jgi:hypothetical protein
MYEYIVVEKLRSLKFDQQAAFSGFGANLAGYTNSLEGFVNPIVVPQSSLHQSQTKRRNCRLTAIR